jgi:hypothetical protein
MDEGVESSKEVREIAMIEEIVGIGKIVDRLRCRLRED